MSRTYVNIYLEKHPTRKMRFANKQALLDFERWVDEDERSVYSTTLEASCFVTKNTGYVDIQTPFLKYNDIRTAGWLSVINYDDNGNVIDSYYGFITDIQCNNFTDNSPSFFIRVLFDIDWWHTLLAQDKLNIADLHGTVNRANVNDLVKSGDYCNPVLYNTFDDREEPVIRTKETSVQFIDNGGDGVDELSFLYFLVRNSVSRFKNQLIHYNDGVHGDYGAYLSPQAVLGVLPLYGKNDIKGIVKAKTGLDESEILYQFNTPLCINNFSDDDIIGMFISSIPPCDFEFDEENSIVTFNFPAYKYSLIELDYRTESRIHESTPQLGTAKIPCPFIFNSSQFRVTDCLDRIDNNFFGVHRPFFKDTDIETRMEYRSYLASIPKYHSHAYTELYLHQTEDILYKSIFYNVNTYIEVQNTPNNGGIIYTLNGNEYLVGYEKLEYDISTSRMYTPLLYLTQEQIALADVEQAKQIGAVVSAVGGVVSAVAGTAMFFTPAQTLPLKAYGTSLMGGGLSSAINSSLSALESNVRHRMMRKGEISRSGSYPVLSQLPIGFQSLKCVVPADEEREVILKHLAMYGYNTFLEPHTILEDHKRKYFNYIQTVDCEFTTPSLNEEVRNDIQSMFNQGVWLWQTYEEFGNFEVPNWQQNVLE